MTHRMIFAACRREGCSWSPKQNGYCSRHQPINTSLPKRKKAPPVIKPGEHEIVCVYRRYDGAIRVSTSGVIHGADAGQRLGIVCMLWGGQKLARYLRKRFSDYRLDARWFRADPEVNAVLENFRRQQVTP